MKQLFQRSQHATFWQRARRLLSLVLVAGSLIAWVRQLRSHSAVEQEQMDDEREPLSEVLL